MILLILIDTLGLLSLIPGNLISLFWLAPLKIAADWFEACSLARPREPILALGTLSLADVRPEFLA